MKNVGTAIPINLFYFDEAGAKEVKPITGPTPIVRNVRITNVTADGAKRAGEIIGRERSGG